MKKIATTTSLALAILFISCTREYDCSDQQIQIAFISYLPSDIDTFVLRKFKSNDNFQTLLDTFAVKYGYDGYYQVFNDTTVVMVVSRDGIKAGFDWQVFIPAKGKTVAISQINSEKSTGKRGWGICSLDPGPSCVNEIYSCKVDNQVIQFSNSITSKNYICIKN